MRLLKFNSVKISTLVTIIFSILEVLVSYVLSLLVVNSKEILIRNVLIVLGVNITNAFFLYLDQRCRFVATII
jgi:hypothetical protein